MGAYTNKQVNRSVKNAKNLDLSQYLKVEITHVTKKHFSLGSLDKKK